MQSPEDILTEAEIAIDGLGDLDASTVAGLRVALLQTRLAMDRLLPVLTSAEMYLGRASVAVAVSSSNYQDRWDQEATEFTKGRSRDDLAPSERFARYKLRSLDEAKQKRAAEKLSIEYDAVVRQVRQIYKHIDGRRMDIHALIRANAFESSLER